MCAVLYLFDLIPISFSESHAKWLLCSSEIFSACWQHFDKSLWYKIVPRCDKILPATRIFRTRKSNARPQFTLRDFYTRKRNCAAFERCQGDYGETKFSIRIKYYCMIWAKLISVILYSAWRAKAIVDLAHEKWINIKGRNGILEPYSWMSA